MIAPKRPHYFTPGCGMSHACIQRKHMCHHCNCIICIHPTQTQESLLHCVSHVCMHRHRCILRAIDCPLHKLGRHIGRLGPIRKAHVAKNDRNHLGDDPRPETVGPPSRKNACANIHVRGCVCRSLARPRTLWAVPHTVGLKVVRTVVLGFKQLQFEPRLLGARDVKCRRALATGALDAHSNGLLR